MPSIALISSQYLFRDPRYLMYAKSYQDAGFNVTCMSLLANITEAQKQTELYQLFNCISLAADHNDSNAPQKSPVSIDKPLDKAASGGADDDVSHNPEPLYTPRLSQIKQQVYSLFIRTHVFVKEQFIRPIYIYYLYNKTIKIIKTKKFQDIINNIDYLHGCEILFGAFAAGYASKLYDKQFIFDAKEHHRYMVPEFSRLTVSFIKKHEEVLFKQAKIIPCISEPIIDCYKELYPSLTDKFVYMPNCQLLDYGIINQQRSKLNQLVNSPQTTKKIKLIVLATYLPFVRGIEYLIQVWEKLNSNNSELHIYLSNLNTISNNYLENICPTTLNKSLFIMPPVKEDDINNTIEQYDIGIIPYLPNATINHLYCCPNKFGQYLRSGLAIISSDTINIPNQIKSHNIGYVYPTDNIINAVSVLKKILSDPSLLIDKQNAALDYYQNIYNWNGCFKNIKILIN